MKCLTKCPITISLSEWLTSQFMFSEFRNRNSAYEFIKGSRLNVVKLL